MLLEVLLEGMINQNIFTESIEVTRVLLILVFWCSVHGPALVGLHQEKGYSNVTAVVEAIRTNLVESRLSKPRVSTALNLHLDRKYLLDIRSSPITLLGPKTSNFVPSTNKTRA